MWPMSDRACRNPGGGATRAAIDAGDIAGCSAADYFRSFSSSIFFDTSASMEPVAVSRNT